MGFVNSAAVCTRTLALKDISRMSLKLISELLLCTQIQTAEFSRRVSSLPESCDLFKKGDEASPQVLSPLTPLSLPLKVRLGSNFPNHLFIKKILKLKSSQKC